ncbi:MAG TPA: preprotein translocase subunit SecA [Burkholderiales bacterium]|nr:preprotein translocase subunit SecA [Burkholderiales bacterium]
MSRPSILAHQAELAAARPYPERSESEPGWHDRAAEFLLATAVRPLRDRLRNPARRLRRVVELAQRHERALRIATDADLATIARSMRGRLRREGFAPDLVGECFALVREAAARTIGKRHFEPQLMGGWGLLQGRLVEMETGEGKTFAATLPACAVALAGYPVHVITVNDYLARRDADEMSPLYRFLGLSVGTVVQGMERHERRDAYARAIAYCTNKELAFDYLRDRVALSRASSRLHLALEKLRGDAGRDLDLVLRGLYFGIVDEADSVFIDEARTPLILGSATPTTEESLQCERALQIAAALSAGEDFTVEAAERNVVLGAPGKAKLAAYCAGLDGVWTSARAREELVTQALSALVLFGRDQHYVVSDGKVQIVDESTGRVMPDRSWEHGLHQLIETKEGCTLTERRETLARLTYQRLFRRYIRLAGMTGTAREVSREIGSVYRLHVVRVPLHLPSRRVYRGARVFATQAEKWQAVADSVARHGGGAGRPVLIGTRSVKASEELSAVLARRGIEHALLNAKQDKAEAEVIALAGEAGRVTVATNMAGRGTDIRLGEGVAERGGLHVILTEYHDSRRVDRQLFGRCGRQGDPGSCEAIVSLEDEIFEVYAPAFTRRVRRLVAEGRNVPAAAYGALRALAQFAAERRGVRVRVQTLKLEQRLEQMLAFSGRGE